MLSIFVNWEMVFCATSLHGNKFDKGIIFGFSESIAQIISGILAQNFNDKPLFLAMIVLCLLSNSSYFWFGEGLMANASLFVSCFAMGAYVNVLYLVIENRIPPHKLGNSFVYLITVSVLIASTTPYVAYSPSPWPSVIMLSTLVSLLLISALLDKGGKYLNKIVEDPNETLGQIDVEFVDNFLKQDNSFEKKS